VEDFQSDRLITGALFLLPVADGLISVFPPSLIPLACV